MAVASDDSHTASGPVRRLPLRWVLVATLIGAICVAGWLLAYHTGVTRLAASVDDALTLTLRTLRSEIERFRYLPAVLAVDPRINEIIDHAPDASRVAATSDYLRTVREHSGADQLYVLDDNGLTLAASNHDEPGSFVGNNYRFRPYFRDALADGAGRFYAVGVTTGKPGYFLSSRVDTAAGRRGVVVVKVDLQPLEATWRHAAPMIGVADDAGVVFLSGNPAWKYRPIAALGDDAITALADNRKYADIPVTTATPLFPGIDTGYGGRAAFEGRDLLLRTRPVDADDWLLLGAAPLAGVRANASLVAALAAVCTLLLSVSAIYLRQRRQMVRFRLEQQATLEHRVEERTRALAREVAERTRAESELRQTQEGLIQAAKLAALGRMSAAIVHEISQPLSAMENTLAATGIHADRGDGAAVRENVSAARTLVRRMQRTIKHLRTFSRKTPATAQPVNILEPIRGALELAEPRARDVGAAMNVEAAAELPPVAGNAVRLEQVFLNLVLNSLDALEHVAERRVDVTARSEADRVIVEVRDTGCGIDDAIRPRVTEPFFTTRSTGEGLGLGLSISHAIVEEFRGTLSFRANPGGGTICTVTLPRHGAAAGEAA